MPKVRWFCVIDSTCVCRECQGWMRAFGSDHVVLIDPRPHVAAYPDGTARFLMTDLHSLRAGQIDSIVATLAAETGDDPAAIRAEILGPEGFPIIVTDHRTVGTDLDQCRRVIKSRSFANVR